jgi:hypothetical protein
VGASIAYSVSYVELDGPGSYFDRGRRFSLLHKPSRQAPGSTQPPIQWLPALYPGIKAVSSYVGHFPLSSVEVKVWSWTSDPAVRLHGVDRNDFTMFCTRSAYFDTFCFEHDQAKNEYAAGLSSAAVFPMCFLSFLGRKAESRTVVYWVEVKLSLSTRWGHIVGIEVQLHSFLTAALGGGEWSASPPEKVAPKALQAAKTTSPLVHKCQTALNDVSTWHAVGLYWFPGHAGVRGNEIADTLARGGSIQKFVRPEPSLGGP